MDTAMPEEKLKETLDQIVRRELEDSVGIRLVRGETKPGSDLCTVHINFFRGFHSSLSLRADTAMLTRLAQLVLEEEHVTPQDLEDVAKEYFNVLCGRIVSIMYKATRVAGRFTVPSFHWGSYSPENRREQFTLNYSSDRDEAAQLVHHVPAPDRRTDTGRTE